MQRHTQQRRQAMELVSGGIEAYSEGKPETDFALLGATLDAQITPAVNLAEKQGGMSSDPNSTATVLVRTSGTESVNAIGMSRQERLQALERHLLRPFPHPTEFYLIDLIDRLTGDSSRYADLDEIMSHAAQQDSVCSLRLGMALAAAVRAGALEKLGSQSGREGSYRITSIGKRYLGQAKAMRVALWKINPLLSIEEICAIVQIEGGDTLSEMITRVKDEEALMAERRREEKKRSPRKNATNSPAQRMVPSTAQAVSTEPHDGTDIATGPSSTVHFTLHPLWAGLALPVQRESYPSN